MKQVDLPSSKIFFHRLRKKIWGKSEKFSQKIPKKSSFFDIFKVPLEMYTRVLENCYALRTFRYSQGRNAIEKCVCWRICFKYFFWKNESVKTHIRTDYGLCHIYPENYFKNYIIQLEKYTWCSIWKP